MTAHNLMVPDQDEARKITDRCGGSNGQDELIRELSLHPTARAERDAARGKGRMMDHVHLSRFDGTDYCQWLGRCSDGFHRPVGRIMQITPSALCSRRVRERQ
jgi:hypothetical protein